MPHPAVWNISLTNHMLIAMTWYIRLCLNTDNTTTKNTNQNNHEMTEKKKGENKWVTSSPVLW